jgi:hypothetical protein
MVVLDLALEESILEDVSKIGAQRSMTFRRVLENSIMCLQACADTIGLFL